MDSKNVLGIIPARGGSKGIPRKNIKELHDRPLIKYSITAALESDAIGRTIVTTDDEEIADVAAAAGAEVPFMRPASLAEDETPTEPVIEHALTELDESFDEFVLLQPTSPLRTAEHIDAAVNTYRSTGAKSLVSVYEDHSYRWGYTEDGATQLNYDGDRSRRQDKSSEYVENGAIYMTDVEAFLETASFTAGRTELYEMSELDSIDIDEPVDMRLAALLLEERR
jgi:N-acylneuraminate cytidylyltransferase/CMP-N,N'-diacetyllegionaminic acid synthase